MAAHSFTKRAILRAVASRLEVWRKVSYESSDILDVEPGPLAIVNRFDIAAPNPTRVVTGSDDVSLRSYLKKPARWPNEC